MFTANSVPLSLLPNKTITITPELTKTHVEKRADVHPPPEIRTYFSELTVFLGSLPAHGKFGE